MFVLPVTPSVPLTVAFPVTLKSFLATVVPDVDPRRTVAAAPPRLTAVADVFAIFAVAVEVMSPPSTSRSPVTFRLLLTCKSFPIVTFPPIVGFGENEITGLDPSPVPPVTTISPTVPEIDST